MFCSESFLCLVSLVFIMASFSGCYVRQSLDMLNENEDVFQHVKYEDRIKRWIKIDEYLRIHGVTLEELAEHAIENAQRIHQNDHYEGLLYMANMESAIKDKYNVSSYSYMCEQQEPTIYQIDKFLHSMETASHMRSKYKMLSSLESEEEMFTTLAKRPSVKITRSRRGRLKLIPNNKIRRGIIEQ